MATYLALESDEEREYATEHVRWLRDRATQLRADKPQESAECDKDAADLEEAIHWKRIL